MFRAGLSLFNVKAIFISHEHSDHIRGVEVLAKRYNIPVYVNAGTLKHCRFRLDATHLRFFESGQTVEIGDFSIHTFSKSHDASDPVSFTITTNGIRVAVITDIGHACENVIDHFSNSHAAFLESNYDEQMLTEGRYPPHLKQRIRSNHGHLSNMQALELFLNKRPSSLHCLILSHLSKENNKPELVEELFSVHAGETQVVVASRYRESAVYQINAEKALTVSDKKTTVKSKSQQISLQF